MLGPTAAITGMVELLGATMLSGKYLARLLREDGKGLWPEVGQGRRGGIELRHLVNFWMAYALCGGRLVDGPKVAYEFGLLQLDSEQRKEPILPPNANTLFFPNGFSEKFRFFKTEPDYVPASLADHLCNLLKALVGDVISKREKAIREWPVIRITLGNSVTPMFAEVSWDEPHGMHYTNVKNYYAVDQKLLPELPLSSDQNKVYRTQVIFGYDQCLAFTSLALKAEDFDVHAILSAAPGSAVESDAIADKTKPAGAGTHSGLQSGQPAPETQTAPLNKAQCATKQARNQRPRKSVAPRTQVRHSHEPERTRRHGTYRPHYASSQDATIRS